jgi:hypothetical protein
VAFSETSLGAAPRASSICVSRGTDASKVLGTDCANSVEASPNIPRQRRNVGIACSFVVIELWDYRFAKSWQSRFVTSSRFSGVGFAGLFVAQRFCGGNACC